MSRLAALKSAASLRDLAELLAFKPKAVAYLLYIKRPEDKYTTFHIPKRNGGHRTIKAPVDGLKVLQRRLSDLLQDCVEEIQRANGRTDRSAHGFTRKRSIVTNAQQHRHRRWVFNLDLEDFFPSINFGRVRGFLIKNRNFQLHERVATAVAQIACHDNELPQGSPSSPIVSNLIAHILDIRLLTLASSAGCTYSRYADDLTFSTNKARCPSTIAVPAGGEGAGRHLWQPSRTLKKAIHRSGFRINVRKTRLMYRSSRQDVTGLVVNEKINVRSEYRRNVRAMVHSLITTGEFTIVGMTRQNGQEVREQRVGRLNELRGMLGFISSIDIYNGYTDDKKATKEKAHREFLIYSAFYAAQMPVIICEGKSDNVYLTHAIRGLAREFPALAEVMPNGDIRLRVRLYRYPGSSTGSILGLHDGGNGVLSQFIGRYRKETKRFGGPGLMNPVIILYDNDDGAKKIRSTIKQHYKRSVTGNEPFVHVFKNMYAVPTPGCPSKIEDLFDPAVKATVVSGKTFKETGADFEPETHYGKVVFAHKVVAKRADQIDFANFRPLLDNLVAVINRHGETTGPDDAD